MKVSKVGFKAKTLVAAVALAASSMASAMVLPSTYNGDLTLSIWDATSGHEASLTLDLGVAMNTAIASYQTAGTTVNFGNIFSNSTYATQFGFATHNAADLRWNVTAGDNNADVERILVTSGLNSGLNLINAQVAGSAQVMQNFLQQFGAATEGGSHNPAQGTFAGSPFTWTSTLAGQLYQGTAAGVGANLGMYFFMDTQGPDYATTSGDPATGYAFQNGSNFGTWNLAANGDLTYSMAAAVVPPAVPVPAALWLLGSAMVGLVGVARRRTNEVA